MNHMDAFSVHKFYGVSAMKQKQNTGKKSICQEKIFTIPRAFPYRIQGPPIIWETFYLQKDAFHFALQFSKDVSVFAFESSFGAKSDGKRRYLVTSLPVFWHYYNQLDPHMRHHYEIIPEGYPCKLFFDLEYAKEMNQDKDGDHMVDILIQYVCLWLKTAFNIACDRSDVLELDASTSVKFSRHLIFQMSHVFENCVIEGQFVRFIFHLLWKFVKLSRQSSLSSAHFKKDDVKKMILEEDDFNSEDNEELIYFTKLYEDIYQTEPNYLNIAENFTATSVKLEPNSHGQDVTSEIEKMAFDNAAKCPEPDVTICHNEINIYGDLSDFTSEQLTLFHSFSLEDLSSLLVQNKDGNETLFCDLGVYTKNRNFRLFLSSKLHQSNPLVLSSRNKFQASAKKDINQITEESIFYSSLVSLQNDSCIKFLPVDPSVATCSGTYGYVKQTAAVKSPMSRETDDVLEGSISSSPFPLIDNFIQSLIKSKGSIYRWTYFKSCNRLVYSITGFRWCWNIQREHKSNNIMYVADLKQGVYYQKCYDPDCQGFKSLARDIPYYALPALYFEKQSFQHNSSDYFNDDNDDLILAAADELELIMSG